MMPPIGFDEALIATCAGLIFGAVGALLAGIGWLIAKRAQASQGWPMVLGRVLSASVRTSHSDEGGISYHPEIQYAYDVGGQTFQNNRLMFGGTLGSGGRGGAQKHVDRYPAGAVVQVYYNPANPKDSTLERRSGQTVFFYALGGLFLVLGCGMPACVWGVLVAGRMSG